MQKVAGALVLLLSLAAGPAMAGDCAPERLDVRNGRSAVRFMVEIADDERERATGLMFRESLPVFGGMLFVYPEEHDVSFWMRNTLIPLDMIFVDGKGVVRAIYPNARPLDETPIYGGNNIKYVLEINGGMANRLGIVPGSELRNPAIGGPDVVWPCD